MEDIISLTHATDIDGVGSAALIRIRYGIPVERAFFTDYKVESIEAAGKGIRKFLRKGTMLLVADLAVGSETGKAFFDIVKDVKKDGGHVMWFDHHPWDGPYAKKIAMLCDVAIFGENRKYCGTEITKRELGIDGKFENEFSKIVHYSDFAIRPGSHSIYKTVGYYALSIASYQMLPHEEKIAKLRHMTEVISGKKLLDSRIKADADRFRRMNDRETERMMKDLYLGKNMALGFAGDIQKTYACMKLIEETGKDLGIYINTRSGRGHMRSVKSDCSLLAAKFNGGGHPHAAGFSPDFKKYDFFKSRDDKKRFLADLERQAERMGIFKGKGRGRTKKPKEALFT